MKDEIILIGAGGHAKVCIEILRDMGEKIEFCVAESEAPDVCAGVPVLRGDRHLRELYEQGYRHAFIAIGSNKIRDKISNMVIQLGFTLTNAISKNAIVSVSAKLGSGVAIMPGVIINSDAEIGDLSIINTGAIVDHDCVIGRAVHIGPQCTLTGHIRVEKRAFLGAGSIVIPNLSIGEDSIIGAGAVVVDDIPNSVTAIGIPARVLGK